MKKIKLIFVALLIYNVTVQAQFQYSYGYNNADNSYSIAIEEKDVLMAGDVNPSSIGGHDAAIIKVDFGGNMIWSWIYGKNGDDYFNSVRILPSNPYGVKYVAVGRTNSFGAGNFDAFLVGTDINGMPIFSHTYGRNLYDEAKCIQVVTTPLSPSGMGLIMIGRTLSFSPTSSIYIILTDLNGTFITSKIITGAQNMDGNWIEQTRDGGYVLTGYATNLSGVRSVYVAKLNPLLGLTWTYKMDPSLFFRSIGMCVKEDINKEIVVTGYSISTDEDVLLLKLDPAGNFLKLKTFNNAMFDRGHNLLAELDPSGNIFYLVSGRTEIVPGSSTDMDAFLLKVDKDLNLQWARRYGLNDYETAYELCKSPYNGYLFTGVVNSFGYGNNDFYYVCTDNNGKTNTGCENELHFDPMKYTDNPISYGSLLNVIGDMRIDVPCKFLDFLKDECGVKKAEELKDGIKNINSKLKVYPSPASTQITIEYNNKYLGGQLQVFDITGKVLFEKQIGISGAMDISVVELLKGLYIIKISNGDNYETIKFLKE